MRKKVEKLAVDRENKAKVFCVRRDGSIMDAYTRWRVQIYCRAPQYSRFEPFDEEAYGMWLDFAVLGK